MALPTEFDLVIVGAGINGAGIARDAAMRRLRVLLIDKADIASGTSSWSTRLIHGGLRYLEHGEISLVRESLREREILLKIAPHLVRPIPILIPIYEGGHRGKMTVRAGMLAYDLLSFDKTLGRHRMLSRAEALTETPAFNPSGLKGAAVFFDAQVEFAERLVLENVLSAREAGAFVLTHARVTAFSVKENGITTVELVNERTSERYIVQTRFVVNAAGPWIDQFFDSVALESERLIGGTKGSHIVVRPFPGAPSSAIYVEARSDGRPFFIIPWNRNILIGTTDIRFAGDIDQVKIDGWEVDYLLAEANNVFPDAHLTRAEVLYTYSGVRPLPFTSDRDEQSITRRHFIRTHPRLRNLVSIVGGKLTTYRSLAEECVNHIFQSLNQKAPRCKTADVPLPGANDLVTVADDFLENSPLSNKVNRRLLRVYGARAQEVLALATESESLLQTFSEEGDAIAAEVVFSFENELATTLDDCLMRRTMLGLNANMAFGDDERAASVAKRFLGWSQERAAQEVVDYRRGLGRFRDMTRTDTRTAR